MTTVRDVSRSPRRLAKAETDEKLANDTNKIEDDLLDGHSAAGIFLNSGNRTGYTYDDLICLPGRIDFGVHDVQMESQFTRTIKLKTPIVSSPMDTVTESKMAIAMALEGGIGIIHTNMPIEAQALEVSKVKKFECGFITDPICIKMDLLLSDLDKLREQCGFSGFPVTEDGKVGSRLLGMLTKRDTDFVRDRSSTRVVDIMTKVDACVKGAYGIELTAANKLLTDSKKGKVPLVSEDGRLMALVSRTDLKKNADFPLAT